MQRSDLERHAHLEGVNFNPINLIIRWIHRQVFDLLSYFIQRLGKASHCAKDIFCVFGLYPVNTL